QHIERYGIHHILSGGAGSSMCDMPWHGDDADTDGNLIKYEQVLNYLIVDINGDSINFQARKVQGNGNNSSSVLESFSL
ncbi:MAG: hypothetical protein GY754_23225, partial [bacterium]|nr:hypothetical protein [bacterium]